MNSEGKHYQIAVVNSEGKRQTFDVIAKDYMEAERIVRYLPPSHQQNFIEFKREYWAIKTFGKWQDELFIYYSPKEIIKFFHEILLRVYLTENRVDSREKTSQLIYQTIQIHKEKIIYGKGKKN